MELIHNAMEVYEYDQFPEGHRAVYVALFKNVKNAAQLRTRIVKAATMEGAEGDAEREAVNFAFVEAKLITSRLHIQTSVYQSILADTQGIARTKTVHSEILWSLNPNNNITEAIRRFGVSPTSTSLILIHVGPKQDASVVEKRMKDLVDGDLSPLSELSTVTDWQLVKKYYRLNEDLAVTSLGKGDNQTKLHAVIDELAVSLVAMKTVMS